jgi:hypothetical protein
MNKKTPIYKNDLKFSENFDLEKSEFYSEMVKKIMTIKINQKLN